MSQTWRDAPPPDMEAFGAVGWLLILLRAPLIAIVVFGGLAVLLLVRLIERPLCGVDRPVTPYITQGVCRAVLRLIGLPLRVTGPRMVGPGAIVANHTSWLDIFVLNSRKNIYFVSKAEVARWPGIGWLARATGTVFIKRDPREARTQTALFQERLLHGHRLLFFPEGTSTDGLRVLPFKTTLFAAFLDERLKKNLQVQAVTVIYTPRDGMSDRFYGWWGEMGFGPSLLQMLAQTRHGSVDLVYHPPLMVRDYANRKALAGALEAQVRGAHHRAVTDKTAPKPQVS